MDRLLLALAIVAVAVVVALVARRRRVADAPTQTTHHVPDQLDPADFRPLVDPESAEAPWMVVVFSSATCHTCGEMVAKARPLASRQVAVVEVEYGAQTDLHRRYRIDAVPTTVVTDRAGVVRASFLGRVSATDLWAEVAEVREPGSRPPRQCDGDGH
ncbi:MAG: thioredoxin family protein [Acidimicrobiales bacterium]|nr:thioredoxin family protein [Acidimicrobiales bacterium]MCB9394813.1 thioredoxin family protein [Acidimicrobiaceae bacterium]